MPRSCLDCPRTAGHFQRDQRSPARASCRLSKLQAAPACDTRRTGSSGRSASAAGPPLHVHVHVHVHVHENVHTDTQTQTHRHQTHPPSRILREPTLLKKAHSHLVHILQRPTVLAKTLLLGSQLHRYASRRIRWLGRARRFLAGGRHCRRRLPHM